MAKHKFDTDSETAERLKRFDEEKRRKQETERLQKDSSSQNNSTTGGGGGGGNGGGWKNNGNDILLFGAKTIAGGFCWKSGETFFDDFMRKIFGKKEEYK